MTCTTWEARVKVEWETSAAAFTDNLPDFDVFRATLEFTADTVERVAPLACDDDGE